MIIIFEKELIYLIIGSNVILYDRYVFWKYVLDYLRK